MSKTPQTISDYIALLTAVKEKYGDLKVALAEEALKNTPDDYTNFEDIVVYASPQSLIRDNYNEESYLVFVFWFLSEVLIMKINRDSLISDYVDRIVDNMSTKDLCRIVGDQLEDNLSSYSDEELIAEISEHYPELLEDW